ncbi:MAG: hypothetical protein ACLQVI_22075 [Polyangiaceae bacterium]
MASKKGTVTDPSAPPFATRGGAPSTPGMSGKPADFSKTPSGNQPRGQRGTDYTRTARPDATPDDAQQPQPTEWPSTAQTPGSPAQRADASSIPRDGSFPPATPASTRGGQCDPGPQPARSPFKNMK